MFFRKPSLRDAPPQFPPSCETTTDHLVPSDNYLIIPKTFSGYFLVRNHTLNLKVHVFTSKHSVIHHVKSLTSLSLFLFPDISLL